MENKKNYAIENGRKYFMYFDLEHDVMKIVDIEETGMKFTSYGEWMCNGKLTHKSLHECMENMHNYRKPILYHGENINVWQPDLFVKYNPYNGEYYRDYHFDSSILEKYEKLA